MKTIQRIMLTEKLQQQQDNVVRTKNLNVKDIARNENSNLRSTFLQIAVAKAPTIP